MSIFRFPKFFSALAVLSAALTSGSAQANSAWQALEIIDMTTTSNLSADVVVTTGFLNDIDLASFDEPTLSVASDGFAFDSANPEKSGWAGLVEVEVDEEPTLAFDEISSFTDSFISTDTEKKMQGFYTMRYQFDSDSAFRPYAGAGLGVVAQSNETTAGGIIAGRATAGFDLTLGEGAALFAEYAVLKNGGVTLGTAGEEAGGSGPDIEHSVKLGFRRTF